MNISSRNALLVALASSTLLTLAPSAARADSFTGLASSAGSSASTAGSASLRGSSDAISGSSNSSTGEEEVAAGTYRIAAIDRVEEDPAVRRVSLEPVITEAQSAAFAVTIPVDPIADAKLATGQKVAVTRRPYGLEFARQIDGKAFFLVLAKRWDDEFGARRVVR